MKFKVLALGAGGNKAAMELINSGIAQESEIILINSTLKDIPTNFSGKTIILSENGSGCGKERSIARDYAIKSAKLGSFDHLFAEDDDSVLLITSLEGGTGSGSTPIIAKYVSEVLGKNVHIIAFKGFDSDVRGLQNSVEFFQEIDFECDIQVIDLKSFLPAAGNNHLRAEELADIEVAERTRILFGQNLIASSQNIDETDIYKVTNTCGYKTIEHIGFKEDLMDVNQFNKLCKQMIYQSHSLKPDVPAQLRLGVILNIKPESEDAVDYDFGVIKEAYGIPYECFWHKQYDGGQQYIQFISSGMKLPLDRIKEIYNNYLEQSAKVNKSDDDFFTEIGKMTKNKEDSKFDMVKSNKKATVSKSAFFGNDNSD